MASEAIASSIVVLRIFALLAFIASVVGLLSTMPLSKLSPAQFPFLMAPKSPSRILFLSVGAAYTLLQLPFGIYYVTTGKRLMHDGVLPELDFFGDQIMVLLVATGVGAGYSISFELKSNYNNFFKMIADVAHPEIEESRDGYHKFFNRAIVATSFLCFGFLCMVAVTSISRRSNRKAFLG